MWFRPTLVISLAVAVHAIEVLLDDECEGNECSLEMLHLRAKKMAVEKGSSAELQEVHGNNLQDEENSKKCLTWANCRNGFFNGIKCSGGRYCTKWGGGRVCKKYVSCRNGFFNGINCHGSRYCVTWGLLQEGEEESAQDIESQNQEADSTDGELNMQEENDLQNDNEENGKKCLTWANCRNGFFNGIKCSGGRYCTKWGGGRVCKKYVSCRDGFFNGINCHGSRYCVTWGLLQEGEEESAQDIESQNQEADSTDGELNMQEENDLQNDNEENGKKCLTWANCRNGFFNGIKCSGGRYCTKWGGGRVCKKYVSCRNGFFNGINCHGSRYCVTWGLLQEGEEESAQDIESQNQEADSTDGELNMQEENDLQNDNEENGKKCLTWANCRNGFFNGIKCSGGRYCTKWGGGRVCKKYVSCRNGFFNGINCHGSRYCVTWGLLQEGEEESAQDIESQNQEADSTDGELNMQEENDLQNDNEENGKKCLTWANCRNGFFNGIKCSGGRYCTKWGGGRVCKKYVSCRNGFFNGINCHGSRYCVTWGLLQEGEEESAQDIESQNQEADSTDGELNMQEENDLQNDNEENGKKCLTWANCRNGFFNGIKCSGGRYCTKWGGGRVCKKYVSCRNGFFNGINCHGSRYCVTWGLLQEGEEESAQADSTDGELNMQEENDLQNDNEENGKKCLTWANCRNGFFNGIKCSGGRYCTKWGGGRVCKKYVSCRNGFFNGINCHGSRYCVTWGLLQEGEEESAQDIESQNQEADSTDGELNMQEENDLQNDNEENGKKCLTWANCRNGFFNGIKCSGGRYCTKWGGGRVCKKYVSCRNGFFNGINCHGSRYCVTWGLLQEGEEESAQDIESQNQEADSTDGELNMQEENDLQNDNEENGKKCLTWANCRNGFFNGIKCSGGRYCTKWGGGRVCKKYVSCRNGFFNGINCHGSRYCVTWGLLQEGEEESAQADSTDGELNMQEENDLQNDNEENEGRCLSWANCRGGFWRGIRCNGGRYCTRWGGGGYGGRRRWRSGGRVCRKYVSCRNGFFNGINCHGSRYCVSWGLLQEGEQESAKDIESQNQEADGELNENEENGKKCLTWAKCRNGVFNGIKCSGGRYCTKWGGGGVMEHSTRETETRD